MEFKEHKIEITDRNLIKISGVESVGAITEKETNLIANNSLLTITGSNLKAEKLSIEQGELVLSGVVDGIKYSAKKEKQSFIKRLFK